MLERDKSFLSIGGLRQKFQAEGVGYQTEQPEGVADWERGGGNPERAGLEEPVPRPYSAVSKVEGSKDS